MAPFLVGGWSGAPAKLALLYLVGLGSERRVDRRQVARTSRQGRREEEGKAAPISASLPNAVRGIGVRFDSTRSSGLGTPARLSSVPLLCGLAEAQQRGAEGLHEILEFEVLERLDGRRD